MWQQQPDYGRYKEKSNGVFDQLQRFSINLLSRLPTVE